MMNSKTKAPGSPLTGITSNWKQPTAQSASSRSLIFGNVRVIAPSLCLWVLVGLLLQVTAAARDFVPDDTDDDLFMTDIPDMPYNEPYHMIVSGNYSQTYLVLMVNYYM